MIYLLNFVQEIDDFFEKHGDPRVAKWPLMSSPFYTLIICLAYIYVVKILGPNLMQNRKPFQVKKTLLFYNLFQVFFSLYLFYEIGMSGWFTGEYNFRCQPVDYSNKPSALRMLHVARMYYIAKFTEFLDTIFFVLRKKFNQVTTLHVIHHSIMPMSIWIGLKLIPGGHGSFLGLLNSFVHVVMYSYYFLSALGPEMQKYLWWKKYLTTLQLAQFVAIIVHSFQLLFRECDFPKAFVWVIGLHGVMFFILFKNFYDETYKKAKSKNRQS